MKVETSSRLDCQYARRIWGLLLGLAFMLRCTPPPVAKHQSPSIAAASVDRPLATSASGRSATSDAPQDAPCGLPPALLERQWPRQLTPTGAQAPARLGPDSISFAVMPDTQYYTKCRYPHIRVQSVWIAEQAHSRNIQGVIHLGDITESNTPEEWAFVRRELAPVTETLPVFLTTGNHDHGDGGTANRRFTLFQKYFPKAPAHAAALLAETWHAGDIENAYYRVRLPKVTLGILMLEWSPRKASVVWANEVLSKYSSDRVVFVTHAYLYYDSTRYDWATKGEEQEWNPNAYGTSGNPPHPDPGVRQTSDSAYDGERLWNELISKHPGVFLTLNGHVLGDGTGLLTSQGASGNSVHQILANYQMLEQGGLGYLRLLELSADGRTLAVRTYSPSLKRWALAPDQNFEVQIKPPLW